MKALNRQDEDFSPPLTPLLDVMFLLLVFFLVSTSFVKPEKSIDIKLPTADQAVQPPKETDTVFVNVKESGVIVVAGRVIAGQQDLEQTFDRARKENSDTVVVIRGDRKVFHNDIVRVMNGALAAGIEDISIAVFDTDDEEAD